MAKQQTERSVGFKVKTPSGIEIEYQEEPKRLYRAKAPDGEWQENISVTTALQILEKPALKWWGMQVGIKGVIALVDRGLVGIGHTPEGVPSLFVPGLVETEPGTVVPGWKYASTDTDPVKPQKSPAIEDLLTAEKLTVNHVRDAAADRGNLVHRALESWLEDRTLPIPDLYPEAERGYVVGLLKFLTDIGEVKTANSEIAVASIVDGFAGRYDMDAVFKKVSLVEENTRTTPTGIVRSEKRLELPAGRYLLDLKTSRGVYLEHKLQLEAYEGARLECGYPPTKARICVRVDADGTYEAKRSTATYDQFLAVLGAYNAIDALKASEKAAKDSGEVQGFDNDGIEVEA